jgi:hypothetical protein
MNTQTNNPFLHKTAEIKSEPSKNRWSQLEFEPEEEGPNRFSRGSDDSRGFSRDDRDKKGDYGRDTRDRNPTFLRYAAVKKKKEKPKPKFDLEATKDEFPSL